MTLSLFFNSTGALGCRGGLSGKPGGSDRPQEAHRGISSGKVQFVLPRALASPPSQAVSGRTGGPGSTSKVLELGTMTA